MSRGRTLVKICGVTRPEDARLAIELGADLIGLNFHPPSPRALDPARDRQRLDEIVKAIQDSSPISRLKRPAPVPAESERSEPPQPAPAPADPPSVPDLPRPLLAGVFVNEDPSRIEEIAEACALDLIQLHGDEGPGVIARFGDRAIKVFRRASPPTPEELADYSGAWGLLFDVPAESSGGSADYGGTGRSWNYEMLAPLGGGRARPPGPILVAGGIRPGNVRRALELSRADGVDVCSGVESAPGVKDPERMERLFEEVRHGTP